MIYDILAPIYDKINAELDYSAWADFIERVALENMTAKPELVLDLGCGTGKMTLELARRGYDMTGVDISPEMLDIARTEGERLGVADKMLWLCQDMREFELYGTVDLAVSCLDSINHLTTKKDLDTTLSLVHNYLIPDGIFVFDINGKGKFKYTYLDHTYVMEEGDSVCIWQNDYNEKTHLCDFYITLFKEEADGRYSRYDDVERERMYTLKEIRSALTKAGFELLGVYSDFEMNEATDEDDRIYLVARCKKN